MYCFVYYGEDWHVESYCVVCDGDSDAAVIWKEE